MCSMVIFKHDELWIWTKRKRVNIKMNQVLGSATLIGMILRYLTSNCEIRLEKWEIWFHLFQMHMDT